MSIFLLVLALSFATNRASAMIGLFDPDEDILIAQFDGKPDADDIHSQAALGSMLLHPDLSGVEVYAVMGAIGTQSGAFIDSTELFNLIFGAEGSENWTDAKNDWNTSVTRIKNKARTVLDAGGHVWVQEAGQSNITADWIQGLLDDGVTSATIKSNVTVVQHSEWNQNNTSAQDLTFVKDRATYVKIEDGNNPNATPDWHVDNTTFMNEIFAGDALPATEAIWLLANQIVVDSGFSAGYSSIDEGGVDFSDCVENWHIFGIGNNADTVRKFWDRYVIDPAGGGGNNGPSENAFIEDNGIIAFEVESMDPVAPQWIEASSISGFSGDGYFVGQVDSFNQGGKGIISYPIYLNSSGRYQLNWRSRITVGSNNTEHNDTFVRIVDAAGNPVAPVSNSNNATGTWYKAYMNQANTWSWETANKDNDPHSLSWNLAADTHYFLELSVRSQGHSVDRVVLWDHNRHNLANKTTGKGPNASSLNNLANSEFRLADGASKKIAYIYGDVAEDGTVPSGAASPFHQMLLTDTGNRGLSIFKSMVETEGHSIEQFYDQDTTLDAAFLDQFDVVIFSLHQKIWSQVEKTALDTWLQAGGGMLVYSDSAAGGLWSKVGAQNPVGQTAVNNLISQYGMEVTVDQADGVKAIRSGPGSTHPIVADRAVFEGEGVSPVAVDPNGGAIRLIPYENNPDYVVSGTPNISHTQNITIQNPQYAALALATVGEGNVIAMFDRQAMWNNGEGSDIEERDNKEILRRIVNFLAGADSVDNPPSVNAGSDQSVILPNDTANLDGTVTVTNGGTPNAQWTKQSGPGSVTFGNSTQIDTTATFSEAGVYVLRLTASVGQASAFDDVTVNVIADQSNVVAAINSGGPAYTAVDGIQYSADANFTGGSSYTDAAAISGTEDDKLYQSERWGSFTYNVPVARGTYDVLLQFAEIFQTSNGQRIFDLSIEGEVVVNDLDIHAMVGHDSAHDILVSGIAVTDGFLTITTSSVVENPKLSAFRIFFLSSIVDENDNDIDDAWEVQYFGEGSLIDGSGDDDGDGVRDFFEYLYGSDPTDPTERGSPFSAQRNEAGDAIHFSWVVKEGFTLGTHYKAWISTDLSEWNVLPPVDYSISSDTVDGKTSKTLELTKDYGEEVFLRLSNP